jgi:hypothetical protein
MSRFKCHAAGLAIGFIAGGLAAQAQPVVAPLPVTQVPPDVERQLQAAEGQAPQSDLFATANTSLGTNPPLFQDGTWDLRPHLSYVYTYGDGIQAAPGRPTDTVVQEIAPGLFSDLGPHWTVDYTPTWTFYSSRAFHDSLDHAANLSWATEYQEWVLLLTQSYVTSSAPLVETGAQTDQTAYLTTLNATRRLSQELTFGLTFSQNIESASGIYPSVRDWSALELLQFFPTPQFDAGLSLLEGYTEVGGGVEMVYLRPQLKLDWRVTKKTTFEVHGGFENRRFLDSDLSPLNSPVVGGSIHYEPLENTKLILSADKDQSFSYLEDQVNRTTGWSAVAEQRLLQHLLAGGEASRQENTVGTELLTTAPGQNNQVQTYLVRLGVDSLLRRGTITVSYQTTRNTSNIPGFSFSSHQLSFQAGYRY